MYILLLHHLVYEYYSYTTFYKECQILYVHYYLKVLHLHQFLYLLQLLQYY